MKETGIESFSVTGFKPSEYAATFFKEPHKVLAHRKRLKQMKDQAAHELQSSAYQNFGEIVNAANTLTEVESDMTKINTLLTETSILLKSIEGAVKSSRPAAPPAASVKQDTLEDLQWLLDVPEDLDILISEHEYQRAGDLILKVRRLTDNEAYNAALAEIRQDVAHREAALIDRLVAELVSPTTIQTESRRLIDLMAHLGYVRKARDTYLSGRGMRIREDAKKIKFQGDTEDYIAELCAVVFRGLLSVCSDFRELFPQKEVLSGLIVWVSRLIIENFFAAVFQRHVFSCENFSTMVACLHIAERNAEMLDQAGISMAFYVKRVLHRHVVGYVNALLERMEVTLQRQIANDSCESTVHAASTFGELGVDFSEDSLRLTTSGRHFVTDLVRFMDTVKQLGSPELYPTVVSCVTRLLEVYIGLLAEASQKDMNDKQHLSLIANARTIEEFLMPIIEIKLGRMFDRPIHELERTKRHVHQCRVGLKNQFVTRRAAALVDKKICWHTQAYIEQVAQDAPSKPFYQLPVYVHKLCLSSARYLHEKSVYSVVSLLLETIAHRLYRTKAFWVRGDELPEMTLHGLRLLHLDLLFFIRAAGPYATDGMRSSIKQINDRAVKRFLRSNPEIEPDSVLESKDWYENRCRVALNGLKSKLSVRDADDVLPVFELTPGE